MTKSIGSSTTRTINSGENNSGHRNSLYYFNNLLDAHDQIEELSSTAMETSLQHTFKGEPTDLADIYFLREISLIL